MEEKAGLVALMNYLLIPGSNSMATGLLNRGVHVQ